MGNGDNQEEVAQNIAGCTNADADLSCDQIRKAAIKSGSDDPTDGRLPYDWKSHYPNRARIEIDLETWYLAILLLFAVIIIYLTWNKKLISLLSLTQAQSPVFKKYIFYSMSGLFGGVLFAFKNLYKSVARGWWHQDRRIWRTISPIVAMVVGFVVGAMVECNLLSSTSSVSSPGVISIGFLSGYFADRAIGKMREIAAVIFGKSTALKDDTKQ